jgi:hypothetical protein|tara:strand:+ start:2903 stop:3379 length:477 start_codon:yes stop_codon:yes gene_type:complete
MKAKKDSIKYHTEVVNGILHMECRVCGSMKPVGEEAVATTCSVCVSEQYEKEFPFEANTGYKPSGKPRGWAFMKEYVDKDGNVYHRGKEQPGLKGTMKSSIIKPKVSKPKLSKKQRQQIKMDAFAEIGKLKKKLKAARFKKDIKKINSEIKRHQKLIK